MTIEEIFEEFPSEEALMDTIRHTSTAVWKRELIVSDIEAWLANFKGSVLRETHERLIALWLLNHFTYYNEQEVKHLCKVLYRDLLHKIIENSATNKDIEEEIKDFFNVTNIISPEQISGSGGFIAYFFRQENSLPMSLFNFSIDNINNSIKNIIIIDDVTLTGTDEGQMSNFLSKTVKKYSDKKFYLLTLISSDKCYDYLEASFNIEIITAIKLDERDKCFSDKSDIFSEYDQLKPLAKNFAEYYGKYINITEPLGYKDGQYTFGFFYNTPDNTLPIFWGQKNNWTPIVKRYHKNYRSKTYLEDERFV